MGALRLYLALCVVAGHAQTFFHGFLLFNAKVAVVCFFMISGFYMALIIIERGENGIPFILSRAIRLWVPYISVAAPFCLYLVLSGRMSLDAYKAFFNASFFGQDILRFLNVYPITGAKDPLGLDAIAVPQAWSLSIEMQLYILAAFIFPIRRGILLLAITGAILFVASWRYGYTNPPNEIMVSFNFVLLFSAGAGSYLFYRKYQMIFTTHMSATICALSLSVAAICLYYSNGFIPDVDIFSTVTLPFYIAIFVAIPFLFSLTKRSTIDLFLGTLSYPIYLCHIAVIDICNGLFSGHPLPNRLSVLIGTIATAVLMSQFIDKPLTERRRSVVTSLEDSRRRDFLASKT